MTKTVPAREEKDGYYGNLVESAEFTAFEDPVKYVLNTG